MRIIIVIIIVFSIVISGIGQPPGFNKRLSMEVPNTKLYKLFIENDTIVALGVASIDTATWGNGIVLMKFDTFGNLLQSRLIVEEVIGQLPIEMPHGNFQPTPDNGYIMSIMPFLFEYPVVLKTDHEFNIEFIEIYDDTTGYNYQLSDFTPVQDGYLLFGLMNWNDFNSDGYVRKINHDGETVWVKYFGNAGKDDSVLDVAVIDDTTYMVAVGQSLAPNYGYFSLNTINKDGALLNHWQSEPEPEIGYVRGIVSVSDSAILLYGLYVAEILSNNFKLVQSTFSKLDRDFNIEKVQHYGKKVDLDSEIRFYNFEETIDGNFIAVGRTSTMAINNGPTYARGWLMKFSPEGDSIWGRLDTSDVMPVHYLNRQRFGGVGVLSSGSIIAGGYVTNVEDNSSYIWLIKTTNDGCIDTLYCGLVSATAPEPPKARQQVSVYPNPASDMLHITISEGTTSPCTLSVLDMSGRVCGVNATVAEGAASIDVSALQVGLYMLCFKFANGEVLFKKLSVVK